jgi:hypothetical protein
MKAYGGYIAAQRRHLLFLSSTSMMAISFAADSDEDAFTTASKMASTIFDAEEGWYNQSSSVHRFEDKMLDIVIQQSAAELFDEWRELERTANNPPQETL